MKLIKYLILILILWNIPGYLLAYFGSTSGSVSSLASSLLLIFFFFFVKKRHKLLLPFILLGILYFMLSSLNFSGAPVTEPIKEFVRFMIIVVCAGEVLYRTTKKEIYIILLVGSVSIIVNALVFPLANANFYPTYGRFSGFYLNPNFAGSICLVGYALSYSMSNKWLRFGGQLLFTLGGIFTLSRSFFVIWALINIVSIYQDRKNIQAPLIGILMILIVLGFSGKLSLDSERFSALESLFTSKKVRSRTITQDARTETWALYTDMILDKPILGNGYQKFQIHKSGYPGVHNSYMMVIGEAGILPFILMVGIYVYLLIKSYSIFRTEPEYFYLSLVVSIALLVGHGYFSNFYNVFISMYIFIQIKSKPAVIEKKTPEDFFWKINWKENR